MALAWYLLVTICGHLFIKWHIGLDTYYIHFSLKHIKELKPDTPAAVNKGEKQVEDYLQELNETRGGGWTGEVVTYPRYVHTDIIGQ